MTPQSVADLSDVAGALLLRVYGTFLRTNSDFWRLSVEKRSPLTIWGSKFVADFRFWKYGNKKSFSFFRFVFNIFIHEMRRLVQEITKKFLTKKWPHILFHDEMLKYEAPSWNITHFSIMIQNASWNVALSWYLQVSQQFYKVKSQNSSLIFKFWWNFREMRFW